MNEFGTICRKRNDVYVEALRQQRKATQRTDGSHFSRLTRYMSQANFVHRELERSRHGHTFHLLAPGWLAWSNAFGLIAVPLSMEEVVCWIFARRQQSSSRELQVVKASVRSTRIDQLRRCVPRSRIGTSLQYKNKGRHDE